MSAPIPRYETASAEDVVRAMAILEMARRESGRGAIRRRKDGRLYVDFGPKYRVFCFPLGERRIALTPELAEAVLKHVRDELRRERRLETILADFQPKFAPQNLVANRIERWLEVKRREARAGDRARGYVRELERWARPEGHFSWWAEKSIRDVTEGAIEDWSLWLADRRTPGGRPLSAASRARVLGGFHSFLGWMYRRREIPEMPRSYPWPKVPEHEPRTLTMADQDAVLRAIPEIDRGIFLACAHLGLRPNEARALEVSDYRNGCLVIDKKASGPNVGDPVVRGTKSGKAKTLPVSGELAAWIEAHVPRESRLERRRLFLLSSTGRPWSHWSLTDRWRAACRAVGVAGVSLYPGTKHSMATDALRRQVPERTLQAFLGHADPRSTRRYARLASTALVEVLRRT